jgi:hypothetical protein
MDAANRIATFIALGDHLRDSRNQPERDEIAWRAHSQNTWFSPEMVQKALNAIANQMLTTDALTAWTAQYAAQPANGLHRIGVVMAGNIPAVGFHDMLSVLMSGHALMAKLSSLDTVLIQYLIKTIIELNPDFADRIQIVDRLNEADAYIATGSDNSARYFHYYFGKKPNLIRKNRSSVALLTGSETTADYEALGHDLLDYFGLGCRNVSTLLVPNQPDGTPFDPIPLLDTLEPMGAIYRNQHKFVNNYDYNKAIYLVNAVPHLDNGFLLLTPAPDDALVSPISVVYLRSYSSVDATTAWLTAHSDKIQVVSTPDGTLPGYGGSVVRFGQTQQPALTDYADGVDTMAFLSHLSLSTS